MRKKESALFYQSLLRTVYGFYRAVVDSLVSFVDMSI
jgi:hypothetical protein